jgi:hypothetical protein
VARTPAYVNTTRFNACHLSEDFLSFPFPLMSPGLHKTQGRKCGACKDLLAAGEKGGRVRRSMTCGGEMEAEPAQLNSAEPAQLSRLPVQLAAML